MDLKTKITVYKIHRCRSKTELQYATDKKMDWQNLKTIKPF